jgi:hypothetical protein
MMQSQALNMHTMRLLLLQIFAKPPVQVEEEEEEEEEAPAPAKPVGLFGFGTKKVRLTCSSCTGV